MIIRELKKKGRRRLRKRHLKSEFALLQALSRILHFLSFNSDLNAKRLYRSSEKEKERRCLVFVSSTKREIRRFDVVVVQRRQRNV